MYYMDGKMLSKHSLKMEMECIPNVDSIFADTNAGQINPEIAIVTSIEKMV